MNESRIAELEDALRCRLAETLGVLCKYNLRYENAVAYAVMNEYWNPFATNNGDGELDRLIEAEGLQYKETFVSAMCDLHSAKEALKVAITCEKIDRLRVAREEIETLPVEVRPAMRALVDVIERQELCGGIDAQIMRRVSCAAMCLQSKV